MKQWNDLLQEFDDSLRLNIDGPILSELKETGSLTPNEGMSIYRSAYFLRMMDFLTDDYPQCFSVWSDAEKKAIVRSYMKKYPSQKLTAAEFGRNFPDFLEERKLTKERMFLPELAKLEWALVKAFYAEEVTEKNFQGMAEAIREDWLEARFAFSPSLQLLAFEWPIEEIYDDPAGSHSKRAQKVAVYLEDGDPTYRECSEGEFLFLEALSSGLTVGEVLAKNPHTEIRPQDFSTWISSGILVGIEWPQRIH